MAKRKKVKPYGRKQAREYGSQGGKLGGPARKLALSPERRSEIARIASAARWGKPLLS